VQSLAYDPSGALLASGGADTDIFIWDVVNLAGRCKLRGHKDVVTGCAFVPPSSNTSSNGQSKYLISCSKDTFMRVWDITTQSCIQTVVGHRCEIWSMVLCSLPFLPSADGSEEDPSSLLVLTGSADDLLRGYRVQVDGAATIGLGDEEQVLDYCGAVQSQGGEKCAGDHPFILPPSHFPANCAIVFVLAVDLQFCDSLGSVIALTGPSSKTLEMFRLRSAVEIKKKIKRRQKREKEKKQKELAQLGEPAEDADLLLADKESSIPQLGDMLEATAQCKASHKMKSIAVR
jgi:U3 small nucleolar RNA-associated protein 12